MPKLICVILFVCLAGLSGCGGPSAQDDSLAGLTVGPVIREIRDAVNDTIGSLDISLGNNLFRSRQHLELLLGRLDAMALRSGSMLFANLDEAEQQALADLRRLLRDVEALEKVAVNDVESLIDRASSSLATLPFVERLPMVFESSPLFLPALDLMSDGDVQVSVKGVQLAAGEPSLEINGNKCERNELVVTSLGFACDKSHFGGSEAPEMVTAHLRVYSRRTFWDRITFRKGRLYPYEISVSVIPESLGRAIPYIDIEVPGPREERSQGFRHRNAHCSGVRRPLFEFNAREGWRIDPSTIAVSCSKSRSSSCNGLRNVQEQSFGYSCVVQNHGSCGPFWNDARGNCGGTVRWEEVQLATTSESVELSPVELSWGRDEIVLLPEGTESVSVVVEKFNGERVILTERETQDAWLVLEVGREKRQAVLRPRSLEGAMSR